MFAILILLLVLLVYIKLVKLYSTWTERGIKQTNPLYLLGDNAGPILGRQSFYDMIKELYNSFQKERYFGMYQTTLPTVMIRDPELIKKIAVKDFDHFVNHRQMFPEGVEPVWSKNLFSMQDDKWRQMRMTLTPSFTSSKMRNIFNLITECCDVYVKYFQKDNIERTVDLKDMTKRFTNDVIATVAFGIKCDSINDINNEFFATVKAFTNNRLLSFFAYTLFPTLCKVLKVPVFQRKAVQFFTAIVKDTIRIRQELQVVRQDMIHLLLETKKEVSLRNDNSKLEFTDEDIVAQAFIFFLGGFETVSATLYFMGHVLATHPLIQRKLQQEIDETMEKCEGKLTYEALLKMNYIDMVISETLRKWPSLPLADRVCSKAYTLPPNNDNGNPMKIYPGESILFPVVALHYDAKYFPDPENFDPERFNNENKDNIDPYVYMPFGVGPRNCIGSRLALMEIKIFYFYFLLNFDFMRTEKTENPLILNKRSFSMTTENEIWISIKPRNK